LPWKEETLKRWCVLVCVIFLTMGISQDIRLAEQEPGVIPMKVMKVRVDPIGGGSVVILQDIDECKAIPIWIGFSEANAIALEINGVVPPRPMTHDLIKNILEGLRARVERILIHDVRENIIFARVILNLSGEDIPIDARPSDAIALAVRVKAPIFVTDEIYRSLSIDLEKGEGKEAELSV
jgi:bifunctional DNase/RNase